MAVSAPYSDIRFSQSVARILTVAVLFLVVVILGGVWWMSREHDRLAAESAKRMVVGGIKNLESTLSTISLDFAIWPAAVEAIRNDDLFWVWENIGISAVDAGTTDLMIIVPTTGAAPYGWQNGLEQEKPSMDLVPQAVIDEMLGLLTPYHERDRVAPTAYYTIDDETWLLSAARIVSNVPSEVPENDAEIPRLVFGFLLSDVVLSEIGQAFLIDDLSIASNDQVALPSITLDGIDGKPVARIVWTPPRPGSEILRKIALPLSVGLFVMLVVAALTANALVKSARQLETALHDATVASRAKTEFLANVSHELRTPMNGIIGLGSLLERTDLQQRQSEMLEMLMSSAHAQMRLINDLLDVTGIETGQTNLSLAPFSPAAAVEEVCALMRVEAEKKGLTLKLTVHGDRALTVNGDSGKYQQICTNLIGNAIKFTSDGSVEVDASLDPADPMANVTLDVRDTGPGIAEDQRERIFDRFVQVNSADNRRATGTGLGLAITKSLVQLMNGKLSLRSETGVGSVFSVQIPFEISNTGVVEEDRLVG